VLLTTENPYDAARRYNIECRKAARAAQREEKPTFTAINLSKRADKDVLARPGYRNTRTPKQQREFERTLEV
jgi:hypothetical protein